jgi:hypothetical protein
MDIDIDSANRDQILKLISNVSASIHRNGSVVKHNTGVYVTDIPSDPVTGLCTIDYNSAEDMGYIKLDLLNVSLYERIKNSQHLDRLMHTEPDWNMLNNPDFVERIIHINNHYSTLQKMPEPVNSIPRMAMFLSVIRPAKRHLIGLPWKEVAKTVWIKPSDGSYYFKHAHAVSYAMLVAVNMNLETEA